MSAHGPSVHAEGNPDRPGSGLSVSDIIGSTNIMPRLLSDILRPPSERLISYYECVLQAFTTQLFGTTSHTVLMIMAFDRYVAICNPLRYAAIMTSNMVVKLTVSAWGVAFVLVGILLGLTIRLNRCRTLITNPFCDNASLFKLSCESVFINNIYGLTFTVVLLSASIGSIVLTYAKITVVCVTSKNQSLNSKALKTCSTHLMSYLIMLCSGFIVIILHRFPQYSDYRTLSAILFVLVPGSLNPIIYGSVCGTGRSSSGGTSRRLVRGLSFSWTAGRCPSPAREAGRWRGPGTRSAAATLDACRALLADHLSYGDRWGNPVFARGGTLRCASAGAYQLTENWCGPGESDCLIKTSIAKGHASDGGGNELLVTGTSSCSSGCVEQICTGHKSYKAQLSPPLLLLRLAARISQERLSAERAPKHGYNAAGDRGGPGTRSDAIFTHTQTHKLRLREHCSSTLDQKWDLSPHLPVRSLPGGVPHAILL
ncbi:unnamed protein product [Pleuronectes platessa]|uniref:G-protein coupled receptors family 1 profile domain-containing protein n=1 Tax=Pleuronectes platessa TaxID=8262 RepID=A0A9N7YNU9_PLEPL|nr:unnamed protein product [Pleuronectes platessa]